VYLPADGDGRPRGFAFVTFESAADAEDCAAGLNGEDFDGRVIRCNIARARPTKGEVKPYPPRRERDGRGDARGGDYRATRGPPPPREPRIFVSGLPEDIREREIDDLYYRYGRIDYIELRSGRRGPYAIVCFYDDRDADYAARETDGMRFEREYLRVDRD